MLTLRNFHDRLEVLLGLICVFCDSVVNLFHLLNQICVVVFLTFNNYFVDDFVHL